MASSHDNNEADDNNGIKEFLTEGTNQEGEEEACNKHLVSTINWHKTFVKTVHKTAEQLLRIFFTLLATFGKF